jgi:two-component system sensor histidine kinase CpxA
MISRLKTLTGRHLFLRVFLCFWLATAFLILAYAVASTTLRPVWGLAGRDLLASLGAQAADEFEAEGVLGARTYLADLERRTQRKAYLFTAAGDGISGEPVSEGVASLARTLSDKRQIGTRYTSRGVLLGAVTKSSSGAPYVLILMVPRGWVRTALSGGAGTWIPLGSTLLIAALIWYCHARQLAMPATTLRAVAREFAAGNLDARVTDRKLMNGVDEFAELAREFNIMAARIEGLIRNQKRLIADVSHELGSPLARLKLAVSLARKRLGCDAQTALDRIERESDRLDELSQQVLSLVRIESPQRSATPTSLQLDEFIRELVSDCDFEAAATSRRVQFTAVTKCAAEVFPDLLRSALENVIRNAIRYTAEKTVVHVELRHSEADGLANIVVRDHGPGMREACLPYIFEPFYRADFGRDRKSGGAGLGLSIARRAVEAHGGTIQARNFPDGGLVIEIGLRSS